MLKKLRKNIIQSLWENYRANSADMKPIEIAFTKNNIPHIHLDHLAIIDLPGPHTGIPHLRRIFSALGYIERGKDYLSEKQNDFLWMCDADNLHLAAKETLPQVVVADFRTEEMPANVRSIIEKYAKQAPLSPVTEVEKFAGLLARNSASNTDSLMTILKHYFSGRDWPLPTTREFHTVREFNELLAWVLVFGRKPNHFTLSVHLLDHFDSLIEFHEFIEKETQLTLNNEGGIIKGGKEAGISQSSTLGITQTIALADGEIQIPGGFVEFVWRYPRVDNSIKPVLWKDYFTDFIAQHADRVIESLYN